MYFNSKNFSVNVTYNFVLKLECVKIMLRHDCYKWNLHSFFKSLFFIQTIKYHYVLASCSKFLTEKTWIKSCQSRHDCVPEHYITLLMLTQNYSIWVSVHPKNQLLETNALLILPVILLAEICYCHFTILNFWIEPTTNQQFTEYVGWCRHAPWKFNVDNTLAYT